MEGKFLFWKKRIAPVAARMMTWEVTTAFDGTLTETELQKRFDEEFCDAFDRVFFWHLVSFNATDGRKHRYLVAVAGEELVCFRQKFDCCLPKQIALYAVADKILRGEWKSDWKSDWKCGANLAKNVPDDGNLLLVALWENCLYILVFMEGRLCHWSEEPDYDGEFDVLIQERVLRFKDFLKADELFANVYAEKNFGEVYINLDKEAVESGDSVDMDALFQEASRDSFWRSKDLDECNSMKPCEKRRWMLRAVALLVFCVLLFMGCGRPLNQLFENRYNLFADVAPVELTAPALHDLEMLAWAEGHRDLLPANWMPGRHGAVDGSLDKRRSSGVICDASEFKVLGIVGGRVALVKTAAGETRTLSVGDSLSHYRVKQIGMNDVVMRCGRKERRYAVEMR